MVTVSLGQLGQDLRTMLPKDTLWTDIRIEPRLDVQALDITDATAVSSVVKTTYPDVIYHCAAYTNVNGAESNQAAVRAVNVNGTRVVAEAAQAVGATLIVLSTDYVFDGQSTRPYTESDEPHSLSVYGQTKLDGERAALASCDRTFVVRTAWLYGPSVTVAPVKNFPQTIQRLAIDRSELSVINDQIGSPTFTKDLAVAIVMLAQTDEYGIWHVTNSGQATWYDFACEVLRAEIEAGKVNVNPIPTSAYPTLAKRPQYSVLDTTKFSEAFGQLRPWKSALAEYLVGQSSNY